MPADEDELLTDEQVAAADVELGGDPGEQQAQVEQPPPLPARSGAARTAPVSTAGRVAPAALPDDLDLPAHLQQKFGAAKVSELFQRASEGAATAQDLRQLYSYAKKLEGELTAAQASRAAAQQTGMSAPQKPAKPGSWFFSPEYFAAQKTGDVSAFRERFAEEIDAIVESRMKPRLDAQVKEGVQAGLQPVQQAEQQRQQMAFRQHLTERYADLFVKDARFAPAANGKPAGELFAAMDKIYTANQQRLEMWAWQDPKFDPFEFCSKQVLGEMATLGQKAGENKLSQFRARAGSARPTTGATARPKVPGGSALDDFEEVAAERPDLAEGVDAGLMAKLARQMEHAGL